MFDLKGNTPQIFKRFRNFYFQNASPRVQHPIRRLTDRIDRRTVKPKRFAQQAFCSNTVVGFTDTFFGGRNPNAVMPKFVRQNENR